MSELRFLLLVNIEKENRNSNDKIANKVVEPTPLSFAIRLFLGSLFVLFLSII